MQVPLGAQPGAHKVKGTLTGGSAAASGSATFTVDQGPQSPTGSSPATTQFTPLPYTNTTTTPTKWNPPAYAPQQLPTAAVTCDTSGNHATAPSGDVLVIPAYAAGAHSPAAGSTVVAEPMAGRLPIASVGPTAMTPPRLGADPYQYLEVLEQIDPVVSPKLRLAAAAGESFGCLQVEAFGGPGSGYGYLVYALKSALVISAQDATADGSPFVVPTSTASSAGASTTGGTKSASAPASKGAKPAVTTPGDPAAPKAKYERLVLGYASISWEYQEAAGGDKGILHRGAGTVVPAPPSPPLSYSNLVFAFGGLVAATVALMFAYHSRRRDLARRARRSARHA
jgi:hypothetical protein